MNMESTTSIPEKIERLRDGYEKGADQKAVESPVPVDHKDQNARFDATLRGLQDQVKKQEAALEELRSGDAFDVFTKDPRIRLARIRAATEAYKQLSRSEPELPSPISPVPALLSLQQTHLLVTDLKTSITQVKNDLARDRERLKKEQAELRDAHLITAALEARLENVRHDRSNNSEKSATEIAKDLIRHQKKRKDALTKSNKKLLNELHGFVDEHLATMLAAESLGGPIVGDMLDVSEEIIEAGFTAQGKARKPKASKDDEDRAQRRIDELFRRQNGNDEDGDDNGSSSRTREAAAEMRSLIDELLGAGLEAGSSTYVQLGRDSAAARFLVRAKIAQFHPKDAGSLRLFDFGREIDG